MKEIILLKSAKAEIYKKNAQKSRKIDCCLISLVYLLHQVRLN